MENSKLLAKIRKFGGYMSGMVMPILGVFVGWGLMAAFFIEGGWWPNPHLAEMIDPMMKYVIPLLIGYTAGYNIHGRRGGAIGAFTTMGVILGTDVVMISGAMIMGPLSSWVLKKFDNFIKSKTKPGFEMFIDNFSLGIIGAFLTIFGYLTIGPSVEGLVSILSAAVEWVTNQGLIPLLSIFMAPAQVLFLNNVVNHGILAPLGFVQAEEMGKSILFLVDTNNGPLLGTLFAISIFGKGKAKKTAPMAMFIAGIAGIGEVYFPFVLANPVLVFATMGGLAVSLGLLVALGGGLLGVASPGSLIAIFMMTPKDAMLPNAISIIVGFIVAFLIGMLLLKIFGSGNGDQDPTADIVVGGSKVKTVDDVSNSENENSIDERTPIKKVVIACDSGMGSSAMGASVFRNLLKKEGFEDIDVENSSANNYSNDADMVITLNSMIDRAKLSSNNRENMNFVTIENFLKPENYNEDLRIVKTRNYTEE